MTENNAKKQMMKYALLILLLGALLFVGAGLVAQNVLQSRAATENLVLDVNEISQLALAEVGEDTQVGRDIRAKNEVLREKVLPSTGAGNTIWWLSAGYFLLLAVFVVGVFYYLYVRILRPFERLQGYAEQVAAGNLEAELQYERVNFFGDFTWAFDSMRKEILAGRARERDMVEKNKLIISSLSHDIKTPISSMRAYSEALEAELQKPRTALNQERCIGHCQVIMRKCDAMAKLSNDLLTHALNEMNALQFRKDSFCPYEILRALAEEKNALGKAVDFAGSGMESLTISFDRQRFAQILENLFSNTDKYGAYPVRIEWREQEGKGVLLYRDAGPGLAPEDLPFVATKFFRGRNAGPAEGSGLGLYIIRSFMEKVGGTATFGNDRSTDGGFCCVLEFPLESEVAD